MKPKQTKRASTYALVGGGFLHIDRQILPVAKPHKKQLPQNEKLRHSAGKTESVRKEKDE